MGTILLFIVVLSLLVFVHELGHFLVAKKMGMKVEEFGFGFPPRAVGIKKGDTIYSINWIPLGGFVRIKGESGIDREDADSFSSKKAWQRFLVLIAGVMMNLFTAVVIFSIGFMIGLPTMIDSHLPASATIKERVLSVATVVKDSSAAIAGIKEGDVINSIDGQTFQTAETARSYLLEKGSGGVELVVKGQDQKIQTQKLTATSIEGKQLIGIGLVETGLVSYSFFPAIGHAVVATGEFTGQILNAFGQMIMSLVRGHGPGVELSGPVGIAVLTGRVAAMGFVYLLQFVALLSINLAVINVLPLPALDGGRILFLIIEKLSGRPVNQKIETVVHNLGFGLLMLLVIFVTYKDIVHL